MQVTPHNENLWCEKLISSSMERSIHAVFSVHRHAASVEQGLVRRWPCSPWKQRVAGHRLMPAPCNQNAHFQVLFLVA
jgi:hypothetical protein